MFVGANEWAAIHGSAGLCATTPNSAALFFQGLAGHMSVSAFNVDYVNPFIESTCHVVRTMLQMEVSRGQIYRKKDCRPSQDVSGIINFHGAATGVLAFGLSSRAALEATRILVGEEQRQINPTVIDAVGELANIIAGNAKAKLEELQLKISLPCVISGREHSIAFPEGGVAIGIPFQCSFGSIAIEVSMVAADGTV
jgi:chemotaxis protein CheX